MLAVLIVEKPLVPLVLGVVRKGVHHILLLGQTLELQKRLVIVLLQVVLKVETLILSFFVAAFVRNIIVQ